MSYIELHARSAFSFLEGSSLPEDLAGICARLNMPAMALLDTDGVYGAPRFHMAATKSESRRTLERKSPPIFVRHRNSAFRCSFPPALVIRIFAA